MNTIHQGDCLEILRTMADASIDAICTDPPYGLAEHKPSTVTAAITAWTSGDREHVPDGHGFMSAQWDAFVPPPAVWDECLRVLKPGGHLLVFAGTRTVDLMGLSIRLAGFEIRDSIQWLHSQGFPKGKAQLKPASEPILVARKKGPLWLNVDGCRIAADWSTDPNRRGWQGGNSASEDPTGMFNHNGGVRVSQPREGRWPANVVLDEHAAAELDAQSGVLTSGKAGKNGHTRNKPDRDEGIYGGGKGLWQEAGPAGQLFSDSGGASRFFPVFKYQAKAPARERPKVEVDGKQVGWCTVKPLALMRWLVRLVTPPGGTILDPFAGTGTTGQAAELEGFRVVLIERDELALRLIAERLGKAEIKFEVASTPEPAHPLDELGKAIAEADDDSALTALWRANRSDWTPEHTDAAKARLAELREAVA